MSRITAVIFDMFNTLVEDGESYWLSSFQRIVTEQHLGIEAAELRRRWSSGDQQFRERRTSDRVPFQTYCDAWLRSFERTFSGWQLHGDPAGALRIVLEDMGRRPIHRDTLPALEMLQGKCRMAVLSNADDQFLDPVVQRLGVSFEAVLSSEGARCYKPRPELFHTMLRRMGLDPQETAYVGDRQYEDVQGAGQTGMVTVWINRERASMDPDLSKPNYRVESLLEIPALIGQ